jgi:phage terminase large subunit
MENEPYGDVVSFAEEALGLTLYDWQAQAADVVDAGSERTRIKVALVAPNGSGKTERIVALSTLNWLARYPAGRVIVTTADAKQLDSQLMPALRAHSPKFPAWEFLNRSIRTTEGGFVLAFTTDEPRRAEGHHAREASPVLIIVDEAKSVEQGIFEALDRCTYTVLLLISSPGLKAGRFYDAFTKYRADYVCFEVGLKDCPHVSEERIRDVETTYGQEHPLTRSTLYGEFMDYDEATAFLVDYQRLRHLIDNPPHPRLVNEAVAFCDFAGGSAENVIAIRRGNKLERLIAWHERDSVAAVGRFIMEFRKYGLKAVQIWGDNGGGGQMMIDMLASLGWSINRFNFGEPAIRDDVYTSRGAEIWYGFGLLVNRSEMVLPDDATLTSQLTTRKATFDSRARMGVEAKDDMRKRGLASPDRADAVCGVFGIQVGSWLKYVAPRELDPWERLDADLAPKGGGLSESTEHRILRQLGGFTG